jgi:hypothetical protein
MDDGVPLGGGASMLVVSSGKVLYTLNLKP